MPQSRKIGYGENYLMSTVIRHLPWFIVSLVALLLVLVVAQVVTSLPPRSLTILTGPEGGGFYIAAQKYQQLARSLGFALKIRTTNGASETLDLLEKGEGDGLANFWAAAAKPSALRVGSCMTALPPCA
jgi:hypothetical protein